MLLLPEKNAFLMKNNLHQLDGNNCLAYYKGRNSYSKKSSPKRLEQQIKLLYIIHSIKRWQHLVAVNFNEFIVVVQVQIQLRIAKKYAFSPRMCESHMKILPRETSKLLK